MSDSERSNDVSDQMSNMTGENLSERIRILGRKVFKKQEQEGSGRLTLEKMKNSLEVSFQGLTFDFLVSRTLPKEVIDAMNRSVTTDLDQYESLFGYLKMMQSYSLLEPGAVKGNVVLADDQYVTKQQMRMNFGEMGISEKLVLFSDGKNVSDYFDEVLDALDLSYKNANKS